MHTHTKNQNRVATAVLFALAAIAAPALAAEYYLVVPTPGRTEAPPAPSISVTLNPYTLPDGIVGQAYAGFDLNAALQVTGDEAFDAGQVGWSLEGSMLPEGLALTASGAIAGTPTAATDTTGLLFSVLATYKGVQGSQGYRIAVAAPVAPPGQQSFTTAGTHSFTVPEGVFAISALAVGAGGGGGGGSEAGNPGTYSGGGSGGGAGGLSYANGIPVQPGEVLTVVVGAGGAAGSGTTSWGASGGAGKAGGGSSVLQGSAVLVSAGGGQGGKPSFTSAGAGGAGGVGSAGNGGNGGAGVTNGNGGGGGGAAGYAGNGGAGDFAGAGGGGAGGRRAGSNSKGYHGGKGGGVGLLGQGTSGATTAVLNNGGDGGPGSGGVGINYGGGGYGGNRNTTGGVGGVGAVRLIWGEGRGYPLNAN